MTDSRSAVESPEVRGASGASAGRGTSSEAAGGARATSEEQPRPPEPPVEPSVPSGDPEAPVTPPTPATSREGDEQESETEPEDGSPEGAAQAPAEVDVPALREKAAKADEYLDLAQRTRAEFENYRKRAVREAASAQERGAAKLALALLPALDNLDRALAHADQSSEPTSGAEATGAEATGGAADGGAADGGAADTGPAAVDGAASFVSGIRHVQADVLAALGKLGIEAYSPEGEPFDPQLHEAVAQLASEGAPAGTVIEVYQRGYRQGDSVLRPARVVVAQ